MALTLIHNEFKALIDSITGMKAYPLFIPKKANLPAICFEQEDLSRNADSNLRLTSLVDHRFTVTVAASDFRTCHDKMQLLINSLDQYSSGNINLTLVESVADGYDPEFEIFAKTALVAVRYKES